MKHRNKIKQLGRTSSHRKAMFSNMVTSLFEHERIVTTKQKGKELKRISEKIITRAKRNLELSENEKGKKLHNKRVVMKTIKNRDVIKKLFDDIALRFKDRNGGYTRMYLLGRRTGDAAEMAIVELVERKKSENVKVKDKDIDKVKGKEKIKDKEKPKDKEKAKDKEKPKDKKKAKVKEKPKDKEKAKAKEKSKGKKADKKEKK